MSVTEAASDWELLQRYVRDRAEDAFAELVRRHLDLVHSAALRQVRSPQLAEEVAQSAFTDLARNAHRLAPDTILTAWLYQVTRRTAIDVVRRETRRQLREQIATEMNALNAPEANWMQIEPLLDEAVSALDEADRAAVLLRYFENQSLREVGAALGTSDDAAQKRVSRAIERLREFFAKRGVTVGASGLVVVISANAVQAAPVGLALTISTAAAAVGTTLASVATATAIKTAAMTTLQKTLLTAAIAALAGACIYEASRAARLSKRVQELQQAQAPLSEQIQQLQQEREAATKISTSSLEGADKQRWRKEHLELLSLRGRVNQLENELRRRNTDTLTAANSAKLAESDDSDSVLFSASLTNRVPSGQTLVLGGWSKDGMRGYALVTPSLKQTSTSGEKPLSIQSQVVAAPETFWRQIGWQEAKSETHRSALAGLLTADQARILLDALSDAEGTILSNISQAEREDGEFVGIGFSMADDQASGALMGIDLYPRVATGSDAVDLEIRPSPVTTNTPIHPALNPVGQRTHAWKP